MSDEKLIVSDNKENGIQSLKKLYSDFFKGVYRPELKLVQDITYGTFIIGVCYRGLFSPGKIIEEFKMKHNASVFLGKKSARTALFTFTLQRLIQNGIAFGAKSSVIAFVSSLLAVNSFVYRKKISLIDIPVAFGTSFAITRYNLGLKPILSSFVIGCIMGTFATVFLKSVLYFNNVSLEDYWKFQRDNFEKEYQEASNLFKN